MARPTQDELLQLARRAQRGEVFFSWQMHPDDMSLLGSVFMVLSFLSEEQHQELKAEGVAHLYGYLEQAMPRGVNGYPCFMSMGTLTLEEGRWVHAKAAQIQAAVDGVSA